MGNANSVLSGGFTPPAQEEMLESYLPSDNVSDDCLRSMPGAGISNYQQEDTRFTANLPRRQDRS
jgi:hypothetical protein